MKQDETTGLLILLCMCRNNRLIRYYFLMLFLTTGFRALAQQEKTTLTYTLDTSFISIIISGNSLYEFNYKYHNPEKDDERLYRKHSRLIKREPTVRNYDLYSRLACSLWHLSKIREAEQMFLKIVQSEEPYYTTTYFHSSDIPGDTIINTYGYGSFTSSYKNEAALYLTKIYIEKQQFDKALQYLDDAVNKYTVTYTCGTGYNMQQDVYRYLYAACYEGLNRTNDVIDLLLPYSLYNNYGFLIRAINKMYLPQQIYDSLQQAESSITCIPDSIPSFAYVYTPSSGGTAKADTICYYSASAQIRLFGRVIDMPLPYPENGKRYNRDWFADYFRQSEIYKRLTEEE